MKELVIGLLAAIGSVLFFGSYAVPMKTPAVVVSNIDPIIYQSYKSFVCFATSWLVLIYTPLKFTWWGLLGALIWVINGSASVLAVRLVGIGLAQSLWSSLSIIVSYIWGRYIFKEAAKNDTLSHVAVFVMVTGMLGIGAAIGKGKVAISLELNKARVGDQEHGRQAESSKEVLSSLLVKNLPDTCKMKKEDASRVDENRSAFLKGIGLAVLVGILNGSFLIPLEYAHKDVVGVEYLVSFGVGSMVMTLVVLGIHCLLQIFLGHHCPSFQFKVAAGPALLTGLFWSAGNFLSIYATMYLGITVGWPLVQCQLLISALWAVVYYKEVTFGIGATLLVGSSLVVVAGAVMLSVFGIVT